VAVRSDLTVRPAGARDHLGVMRVLDGANLAVDGGWLAHSGL